MVLGLNSVIEEVNNLSHSLQAERGLSTGYTSSNYKNFIEQLSERRKSTDDKMEHFLWLLEQPQNAKIMRNISEYCLMYSILLPIYLCIECI